MFQRLALGAVLVIVGTHLGITCLFRPDDEHISREAQAAAYRRYLDRLIESIKAKGLVADSWAEGDSLVVVPGPYWGKADPEWRRISLEFIAEARCGNRQAPVILRERPPDSGGLAAREPAREK